MFLKSPHNIHRGSLPQSLHTLRQVTPTMHFRQKGRTTLIFGDSIPKNTWYPEQKSQTSQINTLSPKSLVPDPTRSPCRLDWMPNMDALLKTWCVGQGSPEHSIIFDLHKVTYVLLTYLIGIGTETSTYLSVCLDVLMWWSIRFVASWPYLQVFRMYGSEHVASFTGTVHLNGSKRTYA